MLKCPCQDAIKEAIVTGDNIYGTIALCPECRSEIKMFLASAMRFIKHVDGRYGELYIGGILTCDSCRQGIASILVPCEHANDVDMGPYGLLLGALPFITK